MRLTPTLSLLAVSVGLVASGAVVAPAAARLDAGTARCVEPAGASAAPAAAGSRAVAARGGSEGRVGEDHRDVTRRQQRAIERRTDRILEAQAAPGATAAAVVPVYVHVMAAKNGEGNVSRAVIDAQIAEMNQDFAGGESSSASASGFSFTLAGVDRFFNDQWHQDKSSTTYRKATRQGGANALNMWLVDFKYLGIATFPWDYARNPGVDGIRVNVGSLPGGPIANYDEGKTATHEAGHWFGLYHTFQGGCTATNDEVADTPAMSEPTSGCPAGKDTCVDNAGPDPIHNYMDYSYDDCYWEFSGGQTQRMRDMFAAYRR